MAGQVEEIVDIERNFKQSLNSLLRRLEKGATKELNTKGEVGKVSWYLLKVFGLSGLDNAGNYFWHLVYQFWVIEVRKIAGITLWYLLMLGCVRVGS